MPGIEWRTTWMPSMWSTTTEWWITLLCLLWKQDTSCIVTFPAFLKHLSTLPPALDLKEAGKQWRDRSGTLMSSEKVSVAQCTSSAHLGHFRTDAKVLPYLWHRRTNEISVGSPPAESSALNILTSKQVPVKSGTLGSGFTSNALW